MKSLATDRAGGASYGLRTKGLYSPGLVLYPIGRRKVVRVLEGRSIREVEVVTGLSNESETEIVEGLAEEQKIVSEATLRILGLSRMWQWAYIHVFFMLK